MPIEVARGIQKDGGELKKWRMWGDEALFESAKLIYIHSTI